MEQYVHISYRLLSIFSKLCWCPAFSIVKIKIRLFLTLSHLLPARIDYYTFTCHWIFI